MHRYAGRRVGDDVVAATFLAAFRGRERYDPDRFSARPWLFGILTKKIARRHRTRRPRPRWSGPGRAIRPTRPTRRARSRTRCCKGAVTGRTVGGPQGTYQLTPGGKKYPVRCAPGPAYPRGVPTSASGMRAYLYRTSEGQNPPDVQAFITAGDLIRDSYPRRAALAALFEAVIEIPGVSVARGRSRSAPHPGCLSAR